jgi:hypothetical protein
MNVKRVTIDFLLSMRTALVGLGAMFVLMLAGAVIMPASDEFQQLRAMPLFEWLGRQPLSITWWLWLLIAVIAVIALNTLFCSIESIVRKRRVTQWLLLISPQVIHLGFLLVLLAHLFSAAGSSQEVAVAGEGTVVNLKKGDVRMRVDDIDVSVDYYGYISDWKVSVSYMTDGDKLFRDIISPNNPSTYRGMNVNVRDLRLTPVKAVLIQINREPGAAWALAGGILFMTGIVTLIALKIKTER